MSCTTSKKVAAITIYVNATKTKPITISLSKETIDNDDRLYYFIDTIQTIKSIFKPTFLLGVNDKIIPVLNSDSLSVYSENNQEIVRFNNTENEALYNFKYGLPNTDSEKNILFFFDRKDSIKRDTSYINNYLSQNDITRKNIVLELLQKYNFKENIATALLYYETITRKLSLSFFYFRANTNQGDSNLTEHYKFYINEINKQKLNQFSFINLRFMIEEISKVLLSGSFRKIKTKDDVSSYYKSMQQYFVKGTICYDYLVSCIEQQVIKHKIKLKKSSTLNKSFKKSVFKKYVFSKKEIIDHKKRVDTENGYTLYDKNYLPNTFKEIIAKQVGKPTIIDFWASWCGSCINKISEIIEYKKSFKNINFIFVSIDKSHDTWKNFLFKNELFDAEVQYRSNSKNIDELIQSFLTIPKYGLIQKDGSIEIIDEINETIIGAYLKKFE